MGRTVDVIDGRVVYDGRTLAEWVPDVVRDLVAECDPLQIILFGSVPEATTAPTATSTLVVSSGASATS